MPRPAHFIAYTFYATLLLRRLKAHVPAVADFSGPGPHPALVIPAESSSHAYHEAQRLRVGLYPMLVISVESLSAAHNEGSSLAAFGSGDLRAGFHGCGRVAPPPRCRHANIVAANASSLELGV